MSMAGGGKDAFIGAVHRIAAFRDGKIELVCGAFSVNPEISKQSGEELSGSPDRLSATYEERIQQEAQRPEGERMDFLTSVTPNCLHFGPAKLALESGFDVVVEKPMPVTLDEAKELERIVEST